MGRGAGATEAAFIHHHGLFCPVCLHVFDDVPPPHARLICLSSPALLRRPPPLASHAPLPPTLTSPDKRVREAAIARKRAKEALEHVHSLGTTKGDPRRTAPTADAGIHLQKSWSSLESGFTLVSS